MSRLSKGIKKVSNTVSSGGKSLINFDKKLFKGMMDPTGWVKSQTGISRAQQIALLATITGTGMMMGGPGVGMVGAQGMGPSGTPLSPNYINSINNGGGGGFNPMIGPLLGFAGDIYSANKVAQGQQRANEINLQSAREQMAFQERMSSTAHQREVIDLAAAGLNPALSVNAGASSPSGSMATVQNEAPDYKGSIQSAYEIMKIGQEIKESNSRIGLNLAQAQLHNASAKEVKQKEGLYEAQKIMQSLENELYIENGKLMLTEHATKIIKAASEEARGWIGIWLGGKAISKFGGKSIEGAGKLIKPATRIINIPTP